MARKINDIQASIIAAKEADSNLSGLTSTSNTAEWRLWTWIVATAIWINENLFDAFTKDVQATVALQKPHTAQWYVAMAKAFQYGYGLPDDSDVYSEINTDAQIITHAAIAELQNKIRLKVAKTTAGIVGPLSNTELDVLTAYMGRIKDAGVRIEVTSSAPDDFRLAVKAFYDPLVLDNTGARLDGTSATPLQDAVDAYINSLPFNGLFIPNKLIAAMEGVEGIRIAEITYCEARYGDMAYGNPPIEYQYQPDGGYMKLDANYFVANTFYSAHAPII